MHIKKYNFPIIALFLVASFIYSCVQDDIANPHEAAMPHSQMEAAPQLTAADRNDLAQSKGREVKPLTYSQLANRLEFSNGKIHIFQFWKLSCQTCRKINQDLKQLAIDFGEDNIKLIYINLDKKAFENDVNTYIREDGLTGDIFQMEAPDNLSKDGLWNTKLPSMYVVDNEKGIKFFYQQNFTYDELVAIMQPLVL